MSTVVEPPTDADEAVQDAPRRHRWVRWVLVVSCAVIAGMWAYVFLFNKTTIYDDVYLMTTPGWHDAAKEICNDANARRVALSDMGGGMISDPTPAQMIERADIVDQATDIVQQMAADVVAIPVTNAADTSRMEKFERFYGMVIADRRAYTARLRNLELEPYRESEAAGGPVSNVLTDFTSANGIPRCAPPGELGGG